MIVELHAKPLRSRSSVTKRRKAAGVKSGRIGEKPIQKTNDKAAPAWVQNEIFAQARIVAWEGLGEPIQALSVFPLTGSFLDAILLVRAGSRIRWEESIHPLDREKVCRCFAGIKKLPFSIEYRLVAKTGGLVWVRHSVTEIVRKGRTTLLRGFVHDIQTEKELELESLRVSEREQNRIGQDLHDDLCQVLAGISCLMHVAEGRLASKVPEEVAGLSEINQQVIDAMHRTRALTHGLFPGKIQIADVRGALLELVAQVRARFQVEVKTVFVGRFPHHSSNQIIQIYRLAQEAISNAIKHGHATCIEIQLKAKPTTMLLSIIDNGSGLSKSASAETGVGLHIMQYRASTLGGELDVSNAPERGVIVSMQYPFQP